MAYVKVTSSFTSQVPAKEAADISDAGDIYFRIDDLQDGVNAAAAYSMSLEEVGNYIGPLYIMPYINVSDYGATGDGATSDTAAIQRAFDAAIAADTELFFPPGTYSCDSWPTYEHGSGNLRIRGDRATLVHGGTASSFVQLNDGCSSFEMRGMTLQSFYSGVRTEATNWSTQLVDVIIEDNKFASVVYGIFFSDDGAGGVAVANAERIIVRGNSVRTATASGIHVQAEQADVIDISHNVVDGMTASANNLYGIYAKTTKDDGTNYNQQDSVLVHGNTVRNLTHSDNSDTYNCIGIPVQCYGARVTNNRLEEINHASSSDCEGIYVKASNGVVMGNTCYNAGQSQGAIALKGNSFELAGDGSHKGYGLRCIGNTIRADDSDTVDREGIYVGGGDKSVISGNMIEGVRVGLNFDGTYGNEITITGNQLVRLEIPSGTGAGIVLRGADNVIISENTISQPDSGTGTFYGIWTTSGTHSNVKILNNIFHDAVNDNSTTRGIQLSSGNMAGLEVAGNVFENFGRVVASSSGVTVTEYERWAHNRVVSCGGSPTFDSQHTPPDSAVMEGNTEDGDPWHWDGGYSMSGAVYNATTTDATVTSLVSISSSSDHIYHVTANVVATETVDHDEAASYTIVGTFRNDGGTLTQVGSTTTVHSEENTAGWNCTFDVSGVAIRVRVTGAAATNVNWRCNLALMQIS